jgi:hypothetical protein
LLLTLKREKSPQAAWSENGKAPGGNDLKEMKNGIAKT